MLKYKTKRRRIGQKSEPSILRTNLCFMSWSPKVHFWQKWRFNAFIVIPMYIRYGRFKTTSKYIALIVQQMALVRFDIMMMVDQFCYFLFVSLFKKNMMKISSENRMKQAEGRKIIWKHSFSFELLFSILFFVYHKPDESFAWLKTHKKRDQALVVCRLHHFMRKNI